MHTTPSDTPPYLSELSTTADMYSALQQLVVWIRHQTDRMNDPALTKRMLGILEPTLPDLALLRSVSVWQNYRTLKFIRGVRISWDYLQREYPPGHLQRDRILVSLLFAAAHTVNHAFKTPTDMSAARQSQDQALRQYIDQVLRQGLSPNDDSDSSS